MKKLSLITTFFLIGMLLNAQQTFFPTNEGTVLIYKTLDKKDKTSNMLRYTIKEVKGSESNLDITYLCESMDPDEKLIFKDEITIHQKGDKLYMDMSNMLNKSAFQQNGEMPAEIKITGNNMEIPTNLKQGDILPDANVEMTLKLGFINMKMTATVTNRKVEAIEEVTVEAGAFKGYKITSIINSSVMGINAKSQSTEWYAKGIGLIKTESYDKKGKLQSHTELSKLID